LSDKDRNRISRRAFLKATAAAGAVGAASHFLTGCGQKAAPPPVVDDEPEPDVVVKRSFCNVCSANCAMQVQTVDGKVVAIKGNPDDQVGAGKLCVKGYSSWKMLYDPIRLTHPMKRTNPEKGPGVDPGFVKITWEEAFQLAGEKFTEIKDQYGPEAIVVAGRPQAFVERWAKAMGTPNLSRHHDTCYSTQDVTWRVAVTGSGRSWTHDLENAKYILSFGWDQPSKGKNMAAREYVKAVSNGAKAVVINPMLTATGAMADEWIPIKPGTDLAFCLAMMHVIVNEELYDKEFVENFTQGIEEVKKAVSSYTPAWAAEITEVDAATIERIAREFATTKPSVIPSHKRDAGGPNLINGWRVSYAMLILNALVGAIDRPGGVMLGQNPKLPPLDEVFPPVPYPEARKDRFDGFEKNKVFGKTNKAGNAVLADAILSEKPYPLKGMFIRKHNILSFPNAPRFTEALKKLDFVAVCDIIPTEIVMMADVVFPEPHFLEVETMAPRTYNAMYPQLAYAEPVIEKLGDYKGFGSIVIGVAKAMGLGEYFPDGMSGIKLMDEQLKLLGSSLDELKANPTGLWSDEKPYKSREEFGTESKKIELYSNKFKDAGFDPFPVWAPKKAVPSAEYPYYMLVTRHPAQRMTESQNNELVMQVASDPRATIPTSLAQQVGVKTGDSIVIESEVNKITMTAFVAEGLRPDCVSIWHGFGHWSKEMPRAVGVGGNDGDLIWDSSAKDMADRKDPGVGAMMNEICVKVYKA
jgi:thiosulfate reductase/polysulfide reductase chain A